MELQRKGVFIEPGADGILRNAADIRNVPPDALTAARWAISFVDDRSGTLCPSVYLRGSAVTGLFFPGVSDVDLYVIVKNPETRKAVRGRLSAQSYSAPNIELDLAILDAAALLQSPELDAERFLIKTTSVHLHGEDIRPQIRDFRITDHLQFTLQSLPQIRRRLQTQLEKLSSIPQRTIWYQWFAKKLIRASYELIIPRERRFTRDLFPCYERFSCAFAESNQAAAIALEVALGNIEVDRATANDMLQFSYWLSTEYERKAMDPDTPLTLTDDQIVVSPSDAAPDRFPSDPYDGPDGTTDKNDSNTSDG